MPSVKAKENEPTDVLVRRFKRACEKAGIPTEIRAREAYETPTAARKREKAAACKRLLKRLAKEAVIPVRGRRQTQAPAARTFTRPFRPPLD